MECVICLDELNKKKARRKTLECNHTFHKRCINKWLKTSIQCPLCKQFTKKTFRIYFQVHPMYMFIGHKIIFYDTFIKIGRNVRIEYKNIYKLCNNTNFIEISYYNNKYYIYSTERKITNILLQLRENIEKHKQVRIAYISVS